MTSSSVYSSQMTSEVNYSQAPAPLTATMSFNPYQTKFTHVQPTILNEIPTMKNMSF